MKSTIQSIAVGFVAVLSLILALSGCGDDKQVEKEAKEKKSEKFQPDSYYENKNLQELESLCENNDFKACHKAGLEHQDITKVVTLFDKSCNGGYGKGCIGLGLAYEDGGGVKQDTQKTIALYNKAIELGENAGYYFLGYLYAAGDKVMRTYPKAFKYYQKGCEQEDTSSCFQVGYAYYTGNGVKQDFTKAKAFYSKACDLGEDLGCEGYKELQQQGY